MRQFFKFLFASCLGVFLAGFIMFWIGGGLLARVISQIDQPKTIHANSVLHLTFDQPIPELTNNLEINPYDLENRKILGLNDIIHSIRAAASDDNIKGIFIETDGISSGFATASVLRQAIEEFKSEGKFVIAYSKYYTQGAYYLSSVADKIYLNPLGAIELRGFSAQIPFIKEMLDKIGVEMQVFWVGDFKSATEPYRRTEMSDANRLQTREFLDGFYNIFLNDITSSRDISESDLRSVINDFKASDPQAALDYRLVDGLSYRDEVLTEIKNRLGIDDEDKIQQVQLLDYYKGHPKETNYSASDRIAIVYAEGGIVDGKGDSGNTGDETYTKILKKVRTDDKVKALVLRVNSPGGSAMASENIWRELTLIKEAGKPIIVSMGDYAASGGYYIACPADSILAEPNTLTGSIGVFNVFPNFSNLLNEKLGINFDTVKTGDLSAGFTPFYELSEKERKIIQGRTNSLYETFLTRVGDGRNMSRDAVHKIAQGRVWTGEKAVELGLVDRLANLESAVESAANLSDLEDYRIVEYPQPKDPLVQLIEEFVGTNEVRHSSKAILRSELGSLYPFYKFFHEIQQSKGYQMRLPMIVPFN
ncbi:MAG: signal peptide peptidase SppA [Saprospiraceae bacterium]|nr:MAG: signal peptide peptidase SppA [Saprospiraceae bacterium]